MIVFIFHLHLQASTMGASQYWHFACKYSIWHATVTALQFWMADLNQHVLRNAIDQVCKALFLGDYKQQIWSLPEETLFGHFNAFEAELAQEEDESGRESFNIPTPLSQASRIYHVSTMEELSFDPTNISLSPTPPEHYEGHSLCRCRCHSFTCH